jgi:hypothetical protein
MEPKFCTPAQLLQWAREDPLRLLLASLRLVEQLQQRSAQLKEARARVPELEKLLDAARREGKRQAAPFRVPEAKRTQAPKRAGRPAGHLGAWRPPPAQIDQEITVELSACPHCGGQAWGDPQERAQLIEDLPVLRPQVTRLRTYEATCAGCGARHASRHPLQVSRATGAAGTHLGPRALALAADLRQAKHLTVRKTCAVLRDHFGLALSPGGLVQALARVAVKLEPQYHQLQAELRAAPVIHVDETSWWIAGASAWLWVFTHPRATLYVLCQSRGRAVVDAVLGLPFAGVLVSDCLSTYDLAEGVQQKCYAHHLKAIREARDAATPASPASTSFLDQAAHLLRRALALGRVRDQAALTPAELARGVAHLAAAAGTLLGQPCAERPAETVRRRLHKQRDHLFTFLHHPGVDATNNLAERQLRPAVIARKLSCGHKTAGGARVFMILASLAATCAQTATSFLERVAQAARLNSS